MNYITTYSHEWPKRFEQIVSHIKKFVPEECRFHHVGSTSVQNMPAKDIIDLDIEYAPGSLQKVIEGLREAGYEHEGNLGIDGREAFKPIAESNAVSLPAHHLYACERDASELVKHLAYRDYLRANPHRAEWLADEKIAVDGSANSREEYINNKSSAYEMIAEESMAWANKTLHPTPTSSAGEL